MQIQSVEQVSLFLI